jgi:oxygen-independent coproporphyrinogen-3 oxidase
MSPGWPAEANEDLPVPRSVATEVPFPCGVSHAGLYLHIPFCSHLCPFCPYNRCSYEATAFTRFEQAAHQEIDLYQPHLAGTAIGSLYVGGGTPTVDPAGLGRLLDHLRRVFEIGGPTCVELHPANMDDKCLAILRAAGVSQVSIGVESLSDELLGRIGRSHDAATARDGVDRAVKAGFDSVNVDLMFALPGQSLEDWESDLAEILKRPVDQVSTYPLFGFPYSDLGRSERFGGIRRPAGRQVRRMLAATDRRAREAGFERCAVWSWIRPGRKKFSSVTRHHYVGFGPSAASMIGSHFYVNTFDVDAYAACLPARRPIALAMPADRRLEMAYWLFWRAYELEINDDAFTSVFGSGESLDGVFGMLLRPLAVAGMMRRHQKGWSITGSGAYWIHRVQNEYSLNYINRLWGKCRAQPWPPEIVL